VKKHSKPKKTTTKCAKKLRASQKIYKNQKVKNLGLALKRTFLWMIIM